MRSFGTFEVGGKLVQLRVIHILGDGEDIDDDLIFRLWESVKIHKSLFSDYLDGDISGFMGMLLNPNSCWFEFRRLEDDKTVGLAYTHRIIPNFEATAHFALLTKLGKNREQLPIFLLHWAVDKFNLHRVNAEITKSQTGTLRFVKKYLGFVEEGVKREGTKIGDAWLDLVQFGVLKEEIPPFEMEDNGVVFVRRGKERDAAGDEGSDEEDSRIVRRRVRKGRVRGSIEIGR